MKQYLLSTLLLIFFSSAAFGQKQQTLISGNVEHGGYGSPVVKLVTLNGTNAVMVGGRGGWIINHQLVISGGGYGLASEVSTPNDSLMDFGYGGFTLEYIINSDGLLHLSVETMIGGGGLGQRNHDHVVGDVAQNDQFFLIEPGVHAELNVTSFFRVGAGVSYRLTNGINSWGLKDVDFSGYSANIIFKFGSF